MRKVLATEASGFVGGNVALGLLVERYQVHRIFRQGTALRRLDDGLDDLRVHKADLQGKVGLAAVLFL